MIYPINTNNITSSAIGKEFRVVIWSCVTFINLHFVSHFMQGRSFQFFEALSVTRPKNKSKFVLLISKVSAGDSYIIAKNTFRIAREDPGTDYPEMTSLNDIENTYYGEYSDFETYFDFDYGERSLMSLLHILQRKSWKTTTSSTSLISSSRFTRE